MELHPFQWPRRESNPDLENRNLPFYPLNYEACDFESGKGKVFFILCTINTKRMVRSMIGNHHVILLLRNFYKMTATEGDIPLKKITDAG